MRFGVNWPDCSNKRNFQSYLRVKSTLEDRPNQNSNPARAGRAARPHRSRRFIMRTYLSLIALATICAVMGFTSSIKAADDNKDAKATEKGSIKVTVMGE